MTSSSTITNALVIAAIAGCGAGCGATPDITIHATRPDSTTELELTMCPLDTPVSGAGCTVTSELFANTTALARTVEVFIGDASTALTAYLQTPNVNCVRVTIALEGPITIAYGTGSATATCAPAASCIPVELSAFCQ
jgi:hypothetical protein